MVKEKVEVKTNEHGDDVTNGDLKFKHYFLAFLNACSVE
jgi:hypothetical protein